MAMPWRMMRKCVLVHRCTMSTNQGANTRPRLGGAAVSRVAAELGAHLQELQPVVLLL